MKGAPLEALIPQIHILATMSSPRRIIITAASIAVSFVSSEITPPIMPTMNPNARVAVIPSPLGGLLDPPPGAKNKGKQEFF